MRRTSRTPWLGAPGHRRDGSASAELSGIPKSAPDHGDEGHTLGGADILNRTYSYNLSTDKGPNLDKVDDQLDDDEDRLYLYDMFDRLWRATDPSDGAVVNEYVYNAVGDLEDKHGPLGDTEYVYEGGTSRIQSASGDEPRYYAHDAYGNRIYEGTTPYAGTPSMIYDDANRLVQVRDPVTLANRGVYVYDAFGRRVSRFDAVRQKAFVYVYDTEGHLLQEIEKKAFANDLARTYVYLGDDLAGLADRVIEVGEHSPYKLDFCPRTGAMTIPG